MAYQPWVVAGDALQGAGGASERFTGAVDPEQIVVRNAPAGHEGVDGHHAASLSEEVESTGVELRADVELRHRDEIGTMTWLRRYSQGQSHTETALEVS